MLITMKSNWDKGAWISCSTDYQLDEVRESELITSDTVLHYKNRCMDAPIRLYSRIMSDDAVNLAGYNDRRNIKRSSRGIT